MENLEVKEFCNMTFKAQKVIEVWRRSWKVIKNDSLTFLRTANQ